MKHRALAAAFAFILLSFAACDNTPSPEKPRTQNDDDGDPILNISLDRSAFTLGRLESALLTVSVNPDTALNKNIIWTSSNEDSVTVSSDGTVRGRNWGAATITATTVSGGRTASCFVAVGLSLDVAGKAPADIAAAISAGIEKEGKTTDGSAPQKAFAVKARGVDITSADALSALYKGLERRKPALDPSAGPGSGAEEPDPKGRYIHLDLSDATGAHYAAARAFTVLNGRVPAPGAGNEEEDLFVPADGIDTAGILSVILSGKVTKIEDGSLAKEGAQSDDILTSSEFTGAFMSFTGLKLVSAPGLTHIGSLAFTNCASLETALFPKVTSVGGYAFYACAALAGTEMSGLLSIGKGAFSECPAFAVARFLSVKKIGPRAFARCPALKTVTISSIEHIEDAAFAECGSPAALTVIMGQQAPELGEALFEGVNTEKHVTVKFPPGEYGYEAPPEDSAEKCWGNAFRGMGWAKERYGSGTVNDYITLKFQYY